MEDSLHDAASMRRFARVDLDRIPDETTICKFRRFLDRHRLTEAWFRRGDQYLSDRGLLLSEGTIVDATTVQAPSSAKNRDRQRDPEMGSTKKGTRWYYALKAHVGSGPQGRVHSAVVISASVHDAEIMEDCVPCAEEVIYGDKAFVSAKRQPQAESDGVEWRFLREANRRRRLNCADRSFNSKSNPVRARVEHVFGVIRHLWGYRKVRYRGLAKNAAQVFTLFALADFFCGS